MKQRPVFDASRLTGFAEMDRQHRELFETAARVYDILCAGRAVAAPHAALGAVAELVAHTVSHFASEEALMEEARYPGLRAHRAVHAELMRQVSAMEARLKNKERRAALELCGFLYRWLVHHIDTEDRKFGRYATTPRQD